jgi:hypothetical protein
VPNFSIPDYLFSSDGGSQPGSGTDPQFIPVDQSELPASTISKAICETGIIIHVPHHVYCGVTPDGIHVFEHWWKIELGATGLLSGTNGAGYRLEFLQRRQVVTQHLRTCARAANSQRD